MAKSPQRRSAATLAALLIATGCAWPSPERQLLLDFFQACRLFDTTVLATLATASCNPATDGVVQEFEIVKVDRPEGGAARVVTLDARVRTLGGTAVPHRLTARLEPVNGRWMVVGLTPLPASRTSPAASSDRPN